MGINELISKLRSSTSAPVHSKSDDVDSNTANEKEDAEVELATNGPYDNLHSNVEMHDDPSALVDHYTQDEDYVSTLEPDTVTTFAVSSKLSS